MLSPSLLKNGCSATLITTYKSPAGPPNRPASPLPGKRTRDPVESPDGRSIPSISVRETRPSPLHPRQGVIERPVPPQSEQVTENCRCPLFRVVLPAPAQPPQAVSLEPGS